MWIPHVFGEDVCLSGNPDIKVVETAADLITLLTTCLSEFYAPFAFIYLLSIQEGYFIRADHGKHNLAVSKSQTFEKELIAHTLRCDGRGVKHLSLG